MLPDFFNQLLSWVSSLRLAQNQAAADDVNMCTKAEKKDVAFMDRFLKLVRESRTAVFRVYNEHISPLYRR
jgi:hypothetical protein